jgi:hypothetical protein
VGRRLVLAALLCVAVGADAGTAGARPADLTPAQYKARLAAIGQESNSTQALITKGLSAKKVPVLVAALGQFAKAQDHLANEVSALKPPTKAVAANKQLAKGLHDLASAVRKVATKLKSVPTVAKAKVLLNKDTTGIKAGQEVDAALTVLNKLGYA